MVQWQDSDTFHFDGLLRPGDLVACGQACAEPAALAQQLVQFGHTCGFDFSVFLGAVYSSTFANAPQNMRFLSYGAIGTAGQLADRGALRILPERYSLLPGLFAQGVIRADVVLIQLAQDTQGRLSFGLACDYLREAALHARLVVAEVSVTVPWTYGTPVPEDFRIDILLRSTQAPLQAPTGAASAEAQPIAHRLAELVPDEATLQIGVGTLPDTCLHALAGHRHLGLHSGVLGDAGVALMRQGTLDNSRKGVDLGVSVANTVIGTRTSFDFVHQNRMVEVRHTHATHSATALGQLHKLYAINAAIEVDLSGQANCETLNGRMRGGVGGLQDFARAARACPGGRGITLLPATASRGQVSRIVARLGGGSVTLGKTDMDVVITEYGIADLRNTDLHERAKRLIAIAHPDHRDALAQATHALQRQ